MTGCLCVSKGFIYETAVSLLTIMLEYANICDRMS